MSECVAFPTSHWSYAILCLHCEILNSEKLYLMAESVGLKRVKGFVWKLLPFFWDTQQLFTHPAWSPFFWVVRPCSSSTSMKSCLPAITHHSLCLRSTTRPSGPGVFSLNRKPTDRFPEVGLLSPCHLQFVKLHMLFHYYFLWVGHKLRRWVMTHSPLYPHPAVFSCVSSQVQGSVCKNKTLKKDTRLGHHPQ